MKPEKLILKNLGPYKNETVDFTKLENMFLITGDTGAGKTFIFDAITFALYGKLNGNRASKETHLRSRYVSEETQDVEYSVTFEFSVGNEKYKIYRTIPKSQRDSKGKSKLLGKTLILENFNNEKWERLENPDSKIEKIIGLKLEEFSKIVLLPQGAFAEFLKQNSNERGKILRDIFPVSFYSTIMENVATKLSEKKEKLTEVQNIIKDNSKDIDFSNAEKIINELLIQINNLSEIEKNNIEEQKKISAQIERTRADFFLAQKNEESKKRFEELQKQKQEYQKLSEKLDAAEKANILSKFIDAQKSAKENKLDLENQLANAIIENQNAKTIFDELESHKTKMANLKQNIEQENIQISELEKKCNSAKDLQNAEQQEEKTENEKKQLEQQKLILEEKINQIQEIYKNQKLEILITSVSEKLTKLQSEQNELLQKINDTTKRDENKNQLLQSEQTICTKKKEFDKTQDDIKKTKSQIDGLKKRIEEAQIKNSAFLLSEKLKPNCPCPVCGSLEHPQIAKRAENFIDDNSLLKQTETNLEYIQNSLQEIQNQISAEEARKTQFEKNLAQFDETLDLKFLQNELNKKKTETQNCEQEKNKLLDAQELLSELKSKNDLIKDEYSLALTEYVKAKEQKSNLQKIIGEGETYNSLFEKLDFLKMENEKATKEYSQWNDKFSSAKESLSATKAKEEHCKSMCNNAKEKFDNATKVLKTKIEESEFETIDAVEQSILNSDILNSERKKLNSFNEDLKSAQDAVNSAQKTKPSQELLHELDKQEQELKILTEKFEKNKQELEKKKREHTEYDNAYKKIKSAQKKYETLHKEYEPLMKLNDDLLGKNPRKIQFDTWALAMYFEQVVSFASKRFQDISNGRFQFKLKELENDYGNGYKGLDLMILDNYTGTMSEPCDLSGGEVFEASISLALALTDVVQNNNGGIQLDSLFIDEGFGTLDAENMEKAIEVLTELGEQKMVGLISHVEGIQNHEFINSFVNVHKTKTGSWIEISER